MRFMRWAEGLSMCRYNLCIGKLRNGVVFIFFHFFVYSMTKMAEFPVCVT